MTVHLVVDAAHDIKADAVGAIDGVGPMSQCGNAIPPEIFPPPESC